MFFDEAIATHTEWRMQLRACLAEPGQCGLMPEEVGRADACALGRWIRGEGSVYANEQVFRALSEQHRHFHSIAAEVVRKAQEGELLEAEALLCGEYLRRSGAVISAIVEMKEHALRDVP
ncbi:MAG: CZB domain-containing protein [Thermoanaerobaculia bacterium]|nr:CZB domain-containing protein [Thermoanaerobaculia bacterium]